MSSRETLQFQTPERREPHESYLGLSGVESARQNRQNDDDLVFEVLDASNYSLKKPICVNFK